MQFLESRLLMAAGLPASALVAAPEASSVVAVGTVRGRVFDDADRNGRRSGGEGGVGGVTVFLDADANGARHAEEPAVVTGADGSYVFAAVAAGEHLVRVELPQLASSAAGGDATVVAPRAGRRAVTAKSLAIFGTGAIRGTVTRISIPDYPEERRPARGFRVFVDRNRDGRWQKGERWAKTDAQGRYEMTDLFAGEYPVYTRRKG